MQLTNLLIRLANYQNLQNEQRFNRIYIGIYGSIGLLFLPWALVLPKLFSLYFTTIIFICFIAQIVLFLQAIKRSYKIKELKEIIKWEMKN